MPCLHCLLYKGAKSFNSTGQQILEERTDEEEGEEENKPHDANKHGNSCELSGQHTVKAPASDVLLTFMRFDDACITDFTDILKTHISHCSTMVQSAFFFHLKDNVFQHLFLIPIQIQLFGNERVPFNQFACCETKRKPGSICVIFNQMTYGMQCSVYGSTVILRTAKVLS